jgi:hypothetical protein
MIGGSPIGGEPISSVNNTSPIVNSAFPSSPVGGWSRTLWPYQSTVSIILPPAGIPPIWHIELPQPIRRPAKAISELVEPIFIPKVATAAFYQIAPPQIFARPWRDFTGLVEPINHQTPQQLIPGAHTYATTFSISRFPYQSYASPVFVPPPVPVKIQIPIVDFVPIRLPRITLSFELLPLQPIAPTPQPPSICPYIPLRNDEQLGFDARQDFGFEYQERGNDNVEYRESSQEADALSARAPADDSSPVRFEQTFEFGTRGEEASQGAVKAEEYYFLPGRTEESDSPPGKTEDADKSDGKQEAKDTTPSRPEECR